MSEPDNVFDNTDEIEEAIKNIENDKEDIIDENINAEIVPFTGKAMEIVNENENEENEAVIKEYIRSKYVNESIIPKEIYKLYPELTEQEIEENVHDICHIYKEIEKPLKDRKYNNLFLVKQQIEMKEGYEGINEQIFYKNLPGIYEFHLRGIGHMRQLHIKFWKPFEIYKIEGDLKQIPGLWYKTVESGNKSNFMIIRGYFENKMLNIILLREYFYRPIEFKETNGEKIATKSECTKLKPNELGEIITRIADYLDERKLTYKKKTKIMILNSITFESLGWLNKNPTRNKTFALLNINSINKDGFIIEIEKEEIPLLNQISNIIILKRPKDVVKKIDFQGKMSKDYKFKDLEKPIIKYVKYTKPKLNKEKEFGYKYDKLSMYHIIRFINDNDREKLEQIFPDSLFSKIKIKTDTREREKLTRRELITDLFEKLKKIKNLKNIKK